MPRSNGVYRRIRRVNQVRNTVERSSNRRGGWWWWCWGEKMSKFAESASTFMIMPQPESLRSNGVDRRIQRTKQVRNTIERSSDRSGGGGGGRGENSRDEQIYRRRL